MTGKASGFDVRVPDVVGFGMIAMKRRQREFWSILSFFLPEVQLPVNKTQLRIFENNNVSGWLL